MLDIQRQIRGFRVSWQTGVWILRRLLRRHLQPRQRRPGLAPDAFHQGPCRRPLRQHPNPPPTTLCRARLVRRPPPRRCVVAEGEGTRGGGRRNLSDPQPEPRPYRRPDLECGTGTRQWRERTDTGFSFSGRARFGSVRLHVLCGNKTAIASTVITCKGRPQSPQSPPPAARVLTQGPGFAYRSVRNRGLHVAQHTCRQGPQESKFLLAAVPDPVAGGGSCLK